MAVGPQLGSGRYGVVYTAEIDGAPCALKTFAASDAGMLDRELGAYHAIANVPELRGRVCRLLAVYEPLHRLDRAASQGCCPRALCLERLLGEPADRAFTLLPPPAREQLCAFLKTTLALLHSEAGLAHGDVRDDNILVRDGTPVLFDFTHAVCRSDVTPRRWEQCVRVDLTNVDDMAARAASHDATRYATALLGRIRPYDNTHQAALAGHLRRIIRPSPELLDDIERAVPRAVPELALALADHLAQSNSITRREAAVRLLRKAILFETEGRHDTDTASSLAEPRSWLPRLLLSAAAHSAALECRTAVPVCPTADELYQSAVDASLACGDGDAVNSTLLQIKLEYAKFLQSRGNVDQAAGIYLGVSKDLKDKQLDESSNEMVKSLLDGRRRYRLDVSVREVLEQAIR